MADRGRPTVEGTLLDRRLVFVTGKGGVGKTSVAAAIAELAARSGRRTLVCEMDAKGALAEALGSSGLAFEPTEVEPNLFAMTMNTEDSLREYLRLFVRVPLLGKIGPLARTFDFVADAAPGVKEILAVASCVMKFATATTTSSSSMRKRPATSSLRSAHRR